MFANTLGGCTYAFLCLHGSRCMQRACFWSHLGSSLNDDGDEFKQFVMRTTRQLRLVCIFCGSVVCFFFFFCLMAEVFLRGVTPVLKLALPLTFSYWLKPPLYVNRLGISLLVCTAVHFSFVLLEMPHGLWPVTLCRRNLHNSRWRH